MERILLATNYPNLFELGLFNIQETVIHRFTDKIFMYSNNLKIVLYFIDTYLSI